MKSTIQNNITPGGNQSSSSREAATVHSDSGEHRVVLTRESEPSGPSHKLKTRRHTYIGTLNINTLIQVGKLHNLVTELDKQKILILALQETRFTDQETIDYGNYRIYKSKTDKRVCKGAPILGMAFVVHKSIIESVTEVTPINNRLMTMRIKCANKKYTIINAHAPTNGANKTDAEDTEKYWETLDRVTSKIHKHDTKIILGDFNAQVGKERKYRKTVGDFPAHKLTNKNGVRLVEYCQRHNLKLKSTSLRKTPKKQKTWRSPIEYLGEFQIDHVAISYPMQKEIHNVQVRKGANIDSDHYLTRVKIKFTPRRIKRRRQTIPKFDTQTIERSGVVAKWEEQHTTTWKDFQQKIIKEAQEHIPLKKVTRHPWWNTECEEALEARKQAHQRYNSHKTPANIQEFLRIRKETAKIVRQTKRKHIRDQLDSIEKDFRNYNTRDYYRTFKKQLTGYTTQNLTFRKTDNTLALNNKENCEILAQYFKELLNCPTPTNRYAYNQTQTPNPESPPPTQEEIQHHIKRLKNNRTSGEDGIIAELLKNLGPKALEELTHIITNIWTTETIPDDWKCALIHPLHKKGDKTDVNNYRGISLLQVTYKVLSACLLKRTQEQLEHKIGEYQAGFRPGRSCVEQILNLKNVLKMKALRNRPIVCTFIDFKKAYDSIDRQSLFDILEEQGLDGKTLRLIKQTLTDTVSKVKFMGEISEPFHINTGVRQGDGLSPLLFNLALDKVIKEWEQLLKEQEKWIPIKLGRNRDNLEVNCLAFADDLALLGPDEATAVAQIETLKECAERIGLQVSFEKTQFMASRPQPQKLHTRYGIINRVPYFKYLGETIGPTGDEKQAQEVRLQKIKRALGTTQKIYNKKCLSIHTKVQHYNTVIKPEILYASETLIMNRKKHMEDIQKEERKIIRKILGPRRTEEGYRLQHNATVQEYSNITEDIRKRRLRFYGHVMRLPPHRLTRRIVEHLTLIKSTTPWMKQIKIDLEQAKITDTQDRNTYRRLIHEWKPAPEVRTQRRPKMTEEQKKMISERMKEWWKNRRNKERTVPPSNDSFTWSLQGPNDK